MTNLHQPMYCGCVLQPFVAYVSFTWTVLFSFANLLINYIFFTVLALTSYDLINLAMTFKFYFTK